MNNNLYKAVLENSVRYNGIANPKGVLGKVMGLFPELRKDVKKTTKDIQKIVNDVNSMSLDQQQKELLNLDPNALDEKPKEEKTLKELKNAQKGKFVVRIAPSPSGPLHIGHAYGLLLNYAYAKKYAGKFILRIEDTNPENIYPGAYQMLEDDAKWITNNGVDEIIIQSDRLGIYYDYAEKLVNMGKAYVCNCDNDKWRSMKAKGESCCCRDLSVKDQVIRYSKMFGEYSEGEVVLRLKTDIKHKNPALRDFGIMRIVEHVHPRTGKENRVWPLMLLSVAIDDHELGVTHVLNGKDHADNAKKEEIIMNYLGWDVPEYQHWGRIQFEGLKLKSSEIRRGIERDEYHGWDDIRLPTLQSFKRQGYHPEAFLKFALDMGLTLNDKKVSEGEFFKILNHYNKEILEPTSHRYFFVENPQEIKIEKTPEIKIELDLHPDNKKGGRKFKVDGSFYISKKDKLNLKDGPINRLIDCLNFIKRNGVLIFDSKEYEIYKNDPHKGNIIHFLPIEGNVKVEVLMPNGELALGLGESGLKNLKIGTIIQFERFGFVRFDSIKKGVYSFWFIHK